MQLGTQRAFAPDCIRAAALVLVLTVHFFLHSGFYHKPLQGVGMMLSSVIRMACLPPYAGLFPGWRMSPCRCSCFPMCRICCSIPA